MDYIPVTLSTSSIVWSFFPVSFGCLSDYGSQTLCECKISLGIYLYLVIPFSCHIYLEIYGYLL